MDEWLSKYAGLMVNHSLGVRDGERVLIQFDHLSAKLADQIGVAVIEAGGHPVFRYNSPLVGVARLLKGTDAQVSYIHPVEVAHGEVDCCIMLQAPNHLEHPDFDPARVIMRRRASTALIDRLNELRWLVALCPTEYLAAQLNVSLAECQDYLYQVTVGANWLRIHDRAEAVRQIFKGGSRVQVEAEGTRLSFNIDGREIQPCTGQHNLPDGEAFLAPLERTVEGEIYFPERQVTRHGIMEGVRLTFREGRVVEASAELGMNVLTSILNTDEGAHHLGEFGIGVNDMIRQLTGEILFDEKADGTVHFALGRAYPEVGGTNQSLVHVDFVLNLVRGGSVYLDGRPVCINGCWLLPIHI